MRHMLHNESKTSYINPIEVPGTRGVSCDLAIIEFDDQGTLWKRDQLEHAVELLQERARTSKRGALLSVFVHGWKNNADQSAENSRVARFREQTRRLAIEQRDKGEFGLDHVVGVFLGWRGLTTRMPILKQASFWGRRRTAERLVSYHIRETLFRLLAAAKMNPRSKCLVTGHSMGGLIVGRALGPSLTTLLLANGPTGVRLPADLILLINPALDALASWQFIDALKRASAQVELRLADGSVTAAPGPVIVSINSTADTAISRSYPFGRAIDTATLAFRKEMEPGAPSQRHLATHAEGHVDYLVSHRATVVGDDVFLNRVDGAFNDTPFWIIQVPPEIVRDHSDLENPKLKQLLQYIAGLNRVETPEVETWIASKSTHPGQ